MIIIRDLGIDLKGTLYMLDRLNSEYLTYDIYIYVYIPRSS